MIDLRPYQTDLVAGIRAEFARHRRVLAVAPTGAGKTVTFAYITSSAAAKGNSVYVVAHRAEIVEQISGALNAMGVRHGRIQPGHTMTADPVQVAMIQTLARRLDRVPAPKLLVVDEAHHAVAGTWNTVSSAWPETRILGVTATPQRLDGKGLCNAFDAMVIGPTMADLIDAGYLAKFRYLAPPTKVDMSRVRKRMGDYAIDEMAEAVDKKVITGDAIEHYLQHLAGRPAIAFCVTVAHAEHVAAQFAEAGIRAASVDGKMDKTERRDRIDGIGNGRYQVLTSCELISEGVDVPVVAGAILLRPTQSLGMYLQQVGRALRIKPDGGDAVILDHVGNINRHGMPTTIHPWSLETKPKSKPAPTAQCENCFRVFASFPGWKSFSECSQGMPPGCIFEVKDGVRGPPEVVDGTLELITATRAWSGNIDIVTARGRSFYDLMRLADTEAKLREIAAIRKYKRGWVKHIMDERAAKRAEYA